MNIRKFLDIINRTKNLKLNWHSDFWLTLTFWFFRLLNVLRKLLKLKGIHESLPTAWGFILRASTSRLGFYSVFIFFPSKNFLRLLQTANHILNIGTVPFLPSANFVPFLQFFAGSVSIFRDYPWINSLFMKIVSILSRYCKLQ